MAISAAVCAYSRTKGPQRNISAIVYVFERVNIAAQAFTGGSEFIIYRRQIFASSADTVCDKPKLNISEPGLFTVTNSARMVSFALLIGVSPKLSQEVFGLFFDIAQPITLLTQCVPLLFRPGRVCIVRLSCSQMPDQVLLPGYGKLSKLTQSECKSFFIPRIGFRVSANQSPVGLIRTILSVSSDVRALFDFVRQLRLRMALRMRVGAGSWCGPALSSCNLYPPRNRIYVLSSNKKSGELTFHSSAFGLGISETKQSSICPPYRPAQAAVLTAPSRFVSVTSLSPQRGLLTPMPCP
jgi:hypothetical protein